MPRLHASSPSGSPMVRSLLLELLLRLPRPAREERMDYRAAGVTPEHEPELIAIAASRALRCARPESAESWAPLHAVRALTELRSERAVIPLLDALAADDADEVWTADELPALFAAVGAPAVSPLVELALDRSRDLYPRMVAVESLGKVGALGERERDACIDGLTRVLQRFAGDDGMFNAMVIGELVDLDAREAAVLMKAAFDAGRVNPRHMGDWEDVQIELGLLAERVTPRSDALASWKHSNPWEPRPLLDARSMDAMEVATLQRVVERPGRSWGPKSLRELEGFLFAVACAPEAVPPSEWLDALLDDGEPRGLVDRRDAVGALVALHLAMHEDAHARGLEEPEGLFRDDLVSNLVEDSDVAQWSRGFILGHSWLEDLWELSGELEGLEEDLGPALLTLTFFASRALAQRYVRELGDVETVEELARKIREDWSRALWTYAQIGHIVSSVRKDEAPAEG